MNRPRIGPASRRVFAVVIGAAVLSAALVIPCRAAAQDSTKAAAKAPAADDSRVLPFIGPETVIVGRLDVARVDVDAIEAYVNRMMEQVFKQLGQAPPPPGAFEQMKVQMVEPMKQLREGLAAFTAAGGHHVYMLIDIHDMADDGQPLLVTPLGADADAAKLGELLAEMDSDGSTSVEVGKALVFGQKERVNALKERVDAAGGKPAAGGERPDLAKAFAAAGGEAPLRFALVPGEAARKFMEEHHPTLPEEVGGGDIKLVSRGVRWAAAGVTQKPAIGMNLTVQATDAANSKGLMELFETAVGFLKAQVPPGQAAISEQLAALKPKLQGETITLSVDPAALQMGLFGARASEVRVEAGEAKPAEPEKPDDGGL